MEFQDLLAVCVRSGARVCVSVCVRACARECVCVRARARDARRRQDDSNHTHSEGRGAPPLPAAVVRERCGARGAVLLVRQRRSPSPAHLAGDEPNAGAVAASLDSRCGGPARGPREALRGLWSGRRPGADRSGADFGKFGIQRFW